MAINKRFIFCVLVSCAMIFTSNTFLKAEDLPTYINDKNKQVSLMLSEMELESRAMAEAMSNPRRKKSQGESPEAPKKEGGAQQEIETDFIFTPHSSLDEQTGKLSVTDIRVNYNYKFDAYGLPLESTFNWRYIGLGKKEGIPVALPAQLTESSYGFQATMPFLNLNNTYLRMKWNPSFLNDNWSLSASSFRIPMHYFLIHQPSERLILIAGIRVVPEFESSVSPIFGIIYRPTPELEFNIIPDRPNITYTINERLKVFMEGDTSYSEFETEKDGYKGAVLRYSEVHLGGGIKAALNNYFDLSVSTGLMWNRYLKYRDSLGKVGLKDCSYTEFRLQARM